MFEQANTELSYGDLNVKHAEILDFDVRNDTFDLNRKKLVTNVFIIYTSHYFTECGF